MVIFIAYDGKNSPETPAEMELLFMTNEMSFFKANLLVLSKTNFIVCW